MTKLVEVVARVSDPKKIEVMKNRPGDFNLWETKNGAAVYLSSEDGIKYRVYPLLCNEQFQMNVNEGKNSKGFATVVCSLAGFPIKPFWVKGKKNQREIDKEVDARFSLHGSACIITVNNLGLFLIKKIWIEDRYEYVELKTEEIFSTILKRNGGKFSFNENMFGTRKNLSHFKGAAIAAIKKANIPDGGGPIYFIEKEPEVIFHEEMPPQMALTQSSGRVILSAGMTMRSGTRM